MHEVDWGTVSAIAALVVASFGYLARQMNRLEDRLEGVERSLAGRIEGVERSLGGRIDKLTERYIAHLERHPH
ncbi:MAG: hypothetical protein ACRD0O_16560 [Acidimicrobiia bacterium]